MNSQFPLQRNLPVSDRRRDFDRRGEDLRIVSSEELFCGSHEIAIKHADSFYRLKITRQGKLILNK